MEKWWKTRAQLIYKLASETKLRVFFSFTHKLLFFFFFLDILPEILVRIYERYRKGVPTEIKYDVVVVFVVVIVDPTLYIFISPVYFFRYDITHTSVSDYINSGVRINVYV